MFSIPVLIYHQAMCLLERLSQLGPGTRAAAERRTATLRMEERRRREAQAFMLAHQNLGLSHVGQAFVEDPGPCPWAESGGQGHLVSTRLLHPQYLDGI